MEICPDHILGNAVTMETEGWRRMRLMLDELVGSQENSAQCNDGQVVVASCETTRSGRELPLMDDGMVMLVCYVVDGLRGENITTGGKVPGVDLAWMVAGVCRGQTKEQELDVLQGGWSGRGQKDKISRSWWDVCVCV